jgi:hypothetical protein
VGVSAEIRPLGVPPALATGAAQVILPLAVDVDVVLVVPVLPVEVLVVPVLLVPVDVVEVLGELVEVVPELVLVVPDEGIQQLLLAP